MMPATDETARYVMIGGFLGAGKTTAVDLFAQALTGRGMRVGLITNDQSTGLVDTAVLRSRGFAGGCFCCRFDSLAAAADRLSTERDESKALLERKRCLKKLQKSLDIPDEVLMTLPSVGDIEERARRAREKAERRRQRSQSVKDQKPVTEEEWGI